MKKLFFSLALAFAFLQCNGAILPAEKLLTKDTVALFTITDMSETVKATAGAIGSVGKEALDLGKDAKEKTGKAVDKIKNIFK